MKKVLSIILYIVAFASIIFTVIAPNSEALGIPPAFISTGLLIIATIKEIAEKLQMLTPAEVAEFTNEQNETMNINRVGDSITVKDVENWKANRS